MPNTNEVAQLHARIANLEGRLDALSNVLHACIIITDDTLKRHREDIIALTVSVADTHTNPHTADALREWIGVLSKS
ncbi:MAG: hypothetical protein BGP11_08280 [Rhodobacterales bacterium 65-51]|uniref:hypothetical protein n=1 Tax=uncultured Gemmobacter sp. TaxID=1095917 RepID=UPI000968E1F4|nr:hypothetical protein [uncultured Gemmobacter sp.]OJY36336.1 MAG: hypothetical protein BGP11_08280 [Rhodobacterales bacterium 65-51]